MSLDPNDLERLVPDELTNGAITGSETLRLHLERYEFAAQHLRTGQILDMACGVGYGTALLARSQSTKRVWGIDISTPAIDYARKRYGDDKIEFEVADAMRFTSAEGFDTIVSLETIEHVPRPDLLTDHLVSMLRPEGVLIASVPTTPSVDVNPHHLTDFTEKSFRRLTAHHHLLEIGCFRQVQYFGLAPILGRGEGRMKGLRQNLAAYYLRHPRSLLRRVSAVLRHGLANHYTTIAWQRPTSPET